MERLQSVEQRSLRRAFAVRLERVILMRLSDELPGVVNTLWESPTMLSERFDEWEKGFQLKGGAAVILRQLRKGFGDVPESIRQALNTAEQDQLDFWTDRLLDAASLEELVRDARGSAVP